MARYYVKTKFVFSGVFELEVFNREEAKELILKECGLIMGGVFVLFFNSFDHKF